MSEQMLYISKNAENYSVGLKKLITDISEEMNKGIKDGLAYKLASVENEEVKLYSFIKNEGYDISYKEFTGFISDAKDIITANADFIDSALAEKLSEQISEELSDSDLEQVAGGKMKWWQWLLIGIAAVALVVACVIAAPLVIAIGTAIGAGSAACFAAGTVGLLTYAAVGNIAVVVGAGIAAGVAVAAGTGAGLGALA